MAEPEVGDFARLDDAAEADLSGEPADGDPIEDPADDVNPAVDPIPSRTDGPTPASE